MKILTKSFKTINKSESYEKTEKNVVCIYIYIIYMFVGLTDLKEGRQIDSENESVEEQQNSIGVGKPPIANEELEVVAQPQGEILDL